MNTINQPSNNQQNNRIFSRLFQASVPHNLPVTLTKLVGRQTELLMIRDLIAMNRLVTLFGPGGIGKTRLALYIAYDQIPCFENGVFLYHWQILIMPA